MEVEDAQKHIEEELELEDREEFYEGREKFVQVKEIVEATKKKARDSAEDLEIEVESESEDEIEEEDSEHESDSENSEDENAHEIKEATRRLHDGQCCVLLH